MMILGSGSPGGVMIRPRVGWSDSDQSPLPLICLTWSMNANLPFVTVNYLQESSVSTNLNPKLYSLVWDVMPRCEQGTMTPETMNLHLNFMGLSNLNISMMT